MADKKGFFTALFGKRAQITAVVSYTAGSYIGRRKKNQDNLRAGSKLPYIGARRKFCRQGTMRIRDMELFCVCDGIGGGYRGDLAAKYALKAIRRFMRSGIAREMPLKEVILKAADRAQREVCGFYETIKEMGGCTLVMVAVRGDAYAFLNIGDSPGFLIPADGEICELSQRHNLAWERLRMGQPPDPFDYNCLQRYLGMAGSEAEALAYITEGRLQEGDHLLLCSDGVTNAHTLYDLQDALRRGMTAGQIAQTAGYAERADNCTAVSVTLRQIRVPAAVQADVTECEEPEEQPGEEH